VPVVRKMVLQVAVKDIGQVTDFEPRPPSPGAVRRSRPTRQAGPA
jgi:hypothetical protein